jgi:AcrR family transcriptional regulator
MTKQRNSPSQKRRYRMVARAEATEATRERILTAAVRHFAERPYDEVRLAEIAADAGVTVQTMHSHFGTKEELFVAGWHWLGETEQPRRDSAPVGDIDAAVHLLYDSYEGGGDAVLRLYAVEERIPVVHQMLDEGRTFHRGWVERTFAPMLAGLKGAARERRLVSLVVATDLLVWKLLRREMGLSRAQAERVVIEMIEATKGAR